MVFEVSLNKRVEVRRELEADETSRGALNEADSGGTRGTTGSIPIRSIPSSRCI